MKRARVDGRRWQGRNGNALTGVSVGARFVNPAVSVGILVKDASGLAASQCAAALDISTAPPIQPSGHVPDSSYRALPRCVT